MTFWKYWPFLKIILRVLNVIFKENEEIILLFEAETHKI